VATPEQIALAAEFPEVEFRLEPSGAPYEGNLTGRFKRCGHDRCGGEVSINHRYGKHVGLYVRAEFDSPQQARAISEFLQKQLEDMLPGLKAVKYGKAVETASPDA
jgi:hypothetical protein